MISEIDGVGTSAQMTLVMGSDGSGLGLSIASSFTEACGGDFHVETLADLFTAVVSFPLAEEP